ncbi:MAG TPA: hypothetical protein VFW44_12180 [Bryobacteraceae bacterium]|nr:hypothetical protein [Bryobacteraceae bacterium]
MKKWLPTAVSIAMVAAAWAQEPKPAIDNEHVTVWDETSPKGLNNAAHDTVILWIAGPKARTAEFIAKGSSGGKGTKDDRAVVIELKDAPPAHYENTTGYPAAFPRPHVKKLLENKRVVIWSYRWTPGEPTPMHFHDKDVVVVYLEPTALTSTTPDGAKKLNEYKAFDIRFNLGNRSHTEGLAHGDGSAMMMELK